MESQENQTAALNMEISESPLRDDLEDTQKGFEGEMEDHSQLENIKQVTAEIKKNRDLY